MFNRLLKFFKTPDPSIEGKVKRAICCISKKKTMEERLCEIQCLDMQSKKSVDNVIATVNGDTTWFIHVGKAG